MRLFVVIPLVLLVAMAPLGKALPAPLQLQNEGENYMDAIRDGQQALIDMQNFRETNARGSDAPWMPDGPMSAIRAATPVQQKVQQKLAGNNLIGSIKAATRKLLSTWVGTDVPAFNGASMGYYQGYPNRFRANNAASSMWAAQNGDPNNFGAGYNPYMAPQGRRLLQGTWVGTDAPSFNAAAMGYYQGYPNRFRAGNAASSMWAAQNGDPNNFGAGYNPYMAPQTGFRARRMLREI